MVKAVILFPGILIFLPDISYAQQGSVHALSDTSLGKSTLTLSADPWFAKDKADHLLVSAFITALSYYICRDEWGNSHSKALNFSVGVSLSAGILKEIRDSKSKHGTASYKDLVADLIGIALGVSLFIQGG